MLPASLTTLAFSDDLDALLASVPAGAAVAQLLGEDGRSLLIGRPANLRRWVASQLGAGRPPRPGARPPTNLRGLAAGLAYALTSSAFQQRLVYERVMARHVPAEKRRDLRPPGWLHLDPGERFPRVGLRSGAAAPGCFGPFRDRRAAERAVKALHKLFPLRPCDFAFEPDPALPLGAGCLYAQVRSCSAPCLVRIAEPDYRALAGRAAAFLAGAPARPADVQAWIPPWVGAAEGEALVAERGGGGVELYPLAGGRVHEAAAIVVPRGQLHVDAAALRRAVAAAVSGRGASDAAGGDDMPWLCAWLQAPRRSGVLLRVGDPADADGLAARVREALARLASGRPPRTSGDGGGAAADGCGGPGVVT